MRTCTTHPEIASLVLNRCCLLSSAHSFTSEHFRHHVIPPTKALEHESCERQHPGRCSSTSAMIYAWMWGHDDTREAVIQKELGTSQKKSSFKVVKLVLFLKQLSDFHASPCLANDVPLHRCLTGHQSSTGPVEEAKHKCIKQTQRQHEKPQGSTISLSNV